MWIMEFTEELFADFLKKLIAFDKGCALEMVQSGDIITDHDKLIDRQLERASISCITGFAKLFPYAVKVLTY